MNSLRQVALLVRWQLRRQTQLMPMLVIVQVILAVATIIGYGLLIGEPSRQSALYLVTGTPTIILVITGLVMTPQFLLAAKTEGSLDWMRTLPIPRSLFLAGDLFVWTLVGLPGMVLGLIAGVLRFDVNLSVTPWVIPVAALISLTAAAVGYAVAILLPQVLAQMLTQLLVFVVLLFSPVSFPVDRMPDWLGVAHDFLPVQPMAELMRATLAAGDFTVSGWSVAVLSIWCVASVLAVLAALRRRA
ncbi:ABC-2 type transport system permease protein [Stackebrandtia endophytica]|uniref:ABC-2 type transport system permease protein n=1 Tax=Stackebrandtia endophytica TaxID=1496996 RepID=A0A543B034_9ACTN|nr:ABC transporter permease [Stackebrandtia endophytica]TQL78197.1 ABC-2 type transport system permease protein [Stackebrandtia endophytica]